jgi:hypothetical protein
VTKAFVETTVLADALLKPGPRATAAKSAILGFDESLLPVYAIKEFKAGPLHHYVWFHGKLVTTKSWAKTVTQLRKTAMSPFKYRWVSTAIEALEAAANKNRNVRLDQLVEKYGAAASHDVVQCDRYRFALRSIIMRAWKKRRHLTTHVVHDLECYADEELTEERGLIELGEIECCPEDECALAPELRREPEKLDAMRSAVDAEPSKMENVKRSQVLRDLSRKSNVKLDSKQCRYLGDAVFAFFCPLDATILTTNERDLVPLANALGKKVQTP